MTLVLAYTPAGDYTGAPTLQGAVEDLRHDLFDRTAPLAPGASPRWADDDLVRALDRALDEYSFVAPLVQSVMTAALPGTRAYGLPAGAWWVESVEYPTGLYPARYVTFEELVTPSLGTPGPTSAVPAGAPLPGATATYAWATTYLKSGGETLPGPASVPVVPAGGGAVVTLPLGPPGTVGRRVYKARGGGSLVLVAQVLDNTTTTWTDSVGDPIAGAAAAGSVPPPLADTTANLTQVMLRLRPAEVPTDTTSVLTVTYACKHVLGGRGTSVPERHHDVVLLGAAAYAMLAYQVPTNDLFEYQDGELHDRVDEHTVPAAWLAAAGAIRAQFAARLDEIKQQRNAGVAAVARWGDVPLHWQRL